MNGTNVRNTRGNRLTESGEEPEEGTSEGKRNTGLLNLCYPKHCTRKNAIQMERLGIFQETDERIGSS